MQWAGGGQFSLGKSFPAFGPMGPCLVTPDELPNPDDLAISCWVNGELVQESRTSDMVFGVPRLIAELSAVLPLLPGDVIFTGTPAGHRRQPEAAALPAARRRGRRARSRDSARSGTAASPQLRRSMALHRLTAITIGVPDVAPVGGYYDGVRPRRRSATAASRPSTAASSSGSCRRRRGASSSSASAPTTPTTSARVAREPRARSASPSSARPRRVTRSTPAPRVRVVVRVAARLRQSATAAAAPTNGPGRLDRPNRARRRASCARTPVRPRKLGHVVLGSTDLAASQRFFIDGIGFKVSDAIAGLASFLRCSTDHHNLLVQPAPVPFLHHTSWQVDDVDEIGRGARAMLADDPGRHVWGLGRHHIGSNFFWYLKRSRRQLHRVLRRPRLHRRRPALEAGRVGRRAGPLQLGTAAAALVPRARRPRRADGRRARLTTCAD